MDTKRRKELIEIYKNRRAEIGVISYRCKENDEVFLGISKDTKSDFNSTNLKLSSNLHPNKRLQELWNKYGEEGFELTLAKELKYEDPHEDHTEELEKLRELCLTANPKARKIWR